VGATRSASATLSPRQQVLLAAAVRVVAGSGLRGLTHRAVDTAAGLPQGSCSAYMSTRLALLTGLTEYVAAHFARDIEDLTRRIEGHPEAQRAAQETAAMLRSWLRQPDFLLARMELTLEGSRQPEIARIGRAQSRQLVGIIEQAMTSAGREDCRARATALIAAVDGVLLHALGEAPRDRASYMRDSLELLMGALVGEDPAATD
jgi:DNA-binding transcriptional regulator YbjK